MQSESVVGRFRSHSPAVVTRTSEGEVRWMEVRER